MTSLVDQLPTPDGEGDDATGGEDGSSSTYSDEFVTEIRELMFTPTGRNQPSSVSFDDVGVSGLFFEDDLDSVDGDGDESVAPGAIFPDPIGGSGDPDAHDATPSIRLFPSRVEPEERSAPSLTGLSLSHPAPDEDDEPAPVPNLFASPTAAPAEVAFVPAEEVGPKRNRWLLILAGLLAVVGAIWLTWLAQRGDSVDAPVTTVESVTTTVTPASSTSTAPTTTTPPSTTATTESTTESTTVTTIPTTAAPVVTPRPTTPRRPVTTARPTTTAAPTTAAPTIPDLSLPPPTVVPSTTPTTAAPPPDDPPDPPAEG